jgi:hypothetical protein
MRSRMLGALVIALVVLGVLASGAAGAKPRLWLDESNSGAHEATGAPVRISVIIDECKAEEPGVLASNGRPVDQATATSSPTITCDSSEKLAGSIKSVAFAATGSEMAMTLSSILHIQFEPWCTYALPHKIAFGSTDYSEVLAEPEPTATLDKPASFASCAPTRTLHMYLEVEDDLDDAPLAAEVVG